MAARYDKRDGDGVVLAFDVRSRGRAKRISAANTVDDRHTDAAALEDAYDYTADMVSTAELPDERGLSVDETLSRYESAVRSSPSTPPDQQPGVDGGELESAPGRDGTADEILEAISAQYPRSLSPASSALPRGSVDLERDAPRQRRPGFGSRRMFRTRVRTRAALLIAVVVVSAVVIAAIAFAGAHPRATLDAASHDHPSAKPTVLTVAGKADVATHAPLRPVSGGRQHHKSTASSRRHSKAGKTRTVRRSQTGTSKVTAVHTAASAPSTSLTAGSPQPPGPIGAGGTVGTNCNPKCQ